MIRPTRSKVLLTAALFAVAIGGQSCRRTAPPPIVPPTQSLIFAAIERKDMKLLKEAIEHGGNVNEVALDGQTPLHKAVLAGGGAIFVTTLLDAGADAGALAPQSMNALHLAVFAKDPEIVKCLLAYRSLIDARDYNGSSPLAYAVTGRQLEIVELLLDAGADPCTQVVRAIPLPRIARTVAGNEADPSGPAHRVERLISAAAAKRGCPN